MDSANKTGIGYDKETSEKYTAGQDTFFNVEKVKDGATIAMVDEINSLSSSTPLHTVVDIGCGSNADYLQLWGDSAHAEVIIGVEPSLRMRELLLEKVSLQLKDKLQVADGDWLRTNLDADIADLVVSRFSLHNIKNISDGYKELARILKHGAHAIISLPHPNYCKKELEIKNTEAVEGTPMQVIVFDTTLHYFYHELDAYLGENLTNNDLVLIKNRSLNWGTKDNGESEIPNTLIFVLKKVG